jgi:hypothetical protein
MNPILLNAAIPLFFIEWWYVLLALVGVVLIEATILKMYLSNSFIQIAKWIFKANLISTLGGYIAQSVVRFIIGIVIFLSVSDRGDNTSVLDTLFGNIGVGKYQGGWKNPTILFNFIIAFSICFILSVTIESRLIRRYAGEQKLKKDLWKGVIVANIISYGFLTWWMLWTYHVTIYLAQ